MLLLFRWGRFVCEYSFLDLVLDEKFDTDYYAIIFRTCTSSMYTVTYDQLMEEFNCSKEVATLGLSFFIWGLGMLKPSISKHTMKLIWPCC